MQRQWKHLASWSVLENTALYCFTSVISTFVGSANRKSYTADYFNYCYVNKSFIALYIFVQIREQTAEIHGLRFADNLLWKSFKVLDVKKLGVW